MFGELIRVQLFYQTGAKRVQLLHQNDLRSNELNKVSPPKQKLQNIMATTRALRNGSVSNINERKAHHLNTNKTPDKTYNWLTLHHPHHTICSNQP